MSATARLSLPYIAPQQAQKQVTYNTAMAALDQLVQPAVKSRTTATPPGSPAEGDTWVVAASATGAWVGKDKNFACWLGGAWSFRAPAEGWLAYVLDTAELAVFSAGAWSSFVTNGGAGVAKFGINTTADLTNRLAVASDASLFSHNGTSHRLAINKAAAGNTASLLFEDSFSARAEVGLTGDDAFHVKVSPDGSTWFEALAIAPASGIVSLPHKLVVNANAAPPPADLAGTLLQVAQADGVANRVLIDGFAGNPQLVMRRSDGTAAAPSAVQSAEQLGSVSNFGYGATGYSAGSRTDIIFLAAENWTDTAQGTRVRLRTTTTGTVTPRDVLTLEADGTVALPLGQLVFPATANPSSGATTLDDYREGSFTPTILFSGAGTGIAYAGSGATQGRYTRIGRTVIAQGQVTLTSKGSSTGSAQIGGLPFAAPNDGLYISVQVGNAANFSSVTGGLSGLVAPNSTRVNLYAANNGNSAGLTDANFTNTSTLFFVAIYDAA